MTGEPHQRLLVWLGTHPGAWTSAELAAALGVTDRSIRNYVNRLNAADGPDLIQRTSKGYRLSSASATGPLTAEPAGSRVSERAYALLRRILTSPEPVSIHDLADELDVSVSTVENSLRRLSPATGRLEVAIVRSGDRVSVQGREADQRRLMRVAITDAADPDGMLGADRLQAAYPSYDIREIRRHVAQALIANGLYSNDYTLNPLILDLVIAVDRITDQYTLSEPGSLPDARTDPRLGGAAKDVTEYLGYAYGIEFTPAETAAVALLIASKTTLLRGATDHDLVVEHVGAELVALVRRILVKLDDTYLVDLADDAFVANLALHTHNLLVRARAGRPQPNPLAATIRSTHPLVHELAVFFARELEHETGLSVDPDEIGFIAFHLGSALAKRRDIGDRVTISLVAPSYHDLATQLAERLAAQLGERALVSQVIETGEPEVVELTGQLVVTLIPIPGLHPNRRILVSPLLSDADVDVIDAQVRIQHRRNTWMRLMSQLHELFHDGLFFRSPVVEGRNELLRLLADAMREHTAVPDDFLDQVLDREELSPTAFNDIVAIPHTLGMPAERTSIAVATFERPLDWAGTPVRLVLLVAFSAQDRNLFRDTFDQLVITLTEPANVRRLVEHGRTLGDFLAELSRLMGEE